MRPFTELGRNVLRQNNNGSGDEAMEKFHQDDRPTGNGLETLTRGIGWMMTNSLVLYVVAVLLQRTWTLLNSDVMQLMRRL